MINNTITEEEAQEAAQIIRDYSYQIDVSNRTDKKLQRLLSSLGLVTEAPIDI